MTSIRHLLLASCALLLLAGRGAVAAQAADPIIPQLPQGLTAADMEIGPGDQLKIDVFDNPELATTTYVAGDGSVRMPLIGSVQIAGRSPDEASRRIEAALKAGQILINPSVTVQILQSLSKRVTVIGEVLRPSRYAIESNANVLDVIALAGGISEKGSSSIFILRPGATGAMQRIPVQIDMSEIATSPESITATMQPLQAGDTIYVPKGTFTITGEVKIPGEYRVEAGMLLFQAIARAGGVTPLGSASRTQIRRRGADDKMKDIKGKTDMPIQAGDVIKVGERLF